MKRWQEWLVSRKLPVTVDGEFGPATEKATKEWQTRAGLDADGKVGTQTLKKAVQLGFKDFDGKAPVITKKPVTEPANSHTGLFRSGDELDKKNFAMLSRVHPELQMRILAFLDAAKKDGWRLQIVQSLRTFAEQDALFAKGRTKAPIGKKHVVTNARGGQSNHNYGLACDLAPLVEGSISWNEQNYRLYGKWADIARLSWGGRWRSFKDYPHLELPGLPKTGVLLGWYKTGGLAEVWGNV